jgi:hypothetical protein
MVSELTVLPEFVVRRILFTVSGQGASTITTMSYCPTGKLAWDAINSLK